jgi:hypothetical protein
MAAASTCWAGDFSCSGCGRQRLIADDFSKKQQDKFRKGGVAACKSCVDSKAEAERSAAAARQPVDGAGAASAGGAEGEHQPCAACSRSLSASLFNRTQLSKGPGKQRCRECVEAAEADAAKAGSASLQADIEEARVALQQAEVSGDAASRLKASSKLAALEGQKVTGLKPIVLGRGRGRGRGGGRGRGR